MSDNNIPIVKPQHSKTYELKQSKYKMVSPLPVRSILLGPSGSGKTVALVNLLLDIYRGCFERIYCLSPSINADSQTWQPLKDYIKNDMKLTETDKEKFFFDHYDEEALENIIETQKKLIIHMKKNNYKKLYSICVLIDDLADDPKASRNSKLMHNLYTKGRHLQISTIIATQKFACLSPIIRVNASELYCWRLRNYQDLEMFITELGALASKEDILKLYKIATDEPFSFLYVKLMEHDKTKMFMKNYQQYLVIE
jgi:hypothetical protein